MKRSWGFAVPALLVALVGLAAATAAPKLFAARRAERPREARRIVSVSPSTTEILFALGLGRSVIGVTTACNYPPEAKELPKMGDYGQPAIEAILGARPDLVVGSGQGLAHLLAEARRAGIDVCMISEKRLDDVPVSIEEIARRAGVPGRGRQLADSVRRALAEAREQSRRLPPGERLRVYFEVWPEPPFTAGRETFIDDLIEAAGGHNVAADLGAGWFQPSVERLVAADPEVVILGHREGKTDSAARLLAARTGWSRVSAVRLGNVWGDLDPDIMQRPGPRIIEGLALLRARLELARVLRDAERAAGAK